MAHRHLSYFCRVGHLLAKARVNALGQSTAKGPTAPIMAECSRCQLRYQSRDDYKPPAIICGRRFKDEPCAQNPKPTKKEIKQAHPPKLPTEEQEIKLKRPDICCGNPCNYALPRFDLLYYRRSDKLNRHYQQTWAECPELVRKPKLLCCYEKIIFPPWEKRPREERPETACKQATCTNTKTTCPRFRLPRCGAARRPPKCHVNREPNECRKRKAPFPSFSECKRALANPVRAVECKCLALPTMCEVWSQYHRQRAIKKTSEC